MIAYIVQWSYTSGIGGPWAAGEIVTLDADRAVAINQDSPGVLVEVGAVPDGPIPEARDRMVKKAHRRGQDGDQSPIDKTTFKAVRDKE
jgi:hypothetical protein